MKACFRKLWATPWAFVLTLLLLPLSGFSAEVGGKPEKSDVIVPYAQASANFTPIWVAYEAGLFKKYGLNAKLELLNSQVNVQSVISGDVDFLTSAGPDLINVRLNGARLKYFGGYVWQYLFQVWSNKDINDVKSLKGKTVATTTPRTAADIALRETLKRSGLIPDKDFKVVYMQSMPAILSSLTSGQSAAAAISPPTLFQAKEAGMHLLVDTRQLNIRAPMTTYGAKEDYLKNNPNTVYAFLKSMCESLVVTIKKDPALAKRTIAKYTKTTDQKIIDESYKFYVGYWSMDVRPQLDAIRAQLTYLDEKEFPQARNADPNDFVDNTFVDNLEKSGFFRRIGFGK